MWGGSVPAAYAMQIALALMLAASLARLWQSECRVRTEGRSARHRQPARQPYVLDYDLVVLAVAIAFLVRHGLRDGFRDYEISALAAAWVVPLLSRGIDAVSGIPLGLLALLALYVLTLRRAALDRMGVMAGARGIAQA